MNNKASIQIVDYEPKYQPDFKRLNEEWITNWFKMEENDYRVLDHPDIYILTTGGYIYMALLNNEPVGTCALMKGQNDTFELIKMAVTPRAKGKGIGYMLGKACIEKAKRSGARKIHLESNSVLKPAITLYNKLGFKEVTGIPSPYQRCDIQMELVL